MIDYQAYENKNENNTTTNNPNNNIITSSSQKTDNELNEILYFSVNQDFK